MGEDPKTAEEPPRKGDSWIDCRKYTEDWRVAACAASLKREGTIGKALFNELLEEAKVMGRQVGSTYWSVGLLTGRSTKIVAAKQVEPSFEKHIAVNLDPRELYHEEMYLDNLSPVDKPVLVYMTNKVDNIPALKSNLLSELHPRGSTQHGLRLYRNGPLEIMTEVRDGCAKFGSWDYLASAKKMIGAAIVMPADMWCPGSAKTSFIILYGEYEATEYGMGSRFLIPKHQQSSHKSHEMLNNAMDKPVF